jgi:hypothetical protein
MPLPGTKQAPKKFKGDYRQVKDFIDHYERLLHRYNVTDNKEKCTGIRQYCSSNVRETIEGMTAYHTPNWDHLKATLLKFYDAERNEQRYNERDLVTFIRLSRDNPITSANNFHTYQQKFYRIAGWLHNKSKITEAQLKRYFWCGLPKKLRHQVEDKILIAKPAHDMTQPFDIADIEAAVEKIFMRTRFDVDDSDNELDLDWPESISDSDDESDEDSDDDSKHHSRSKPKSRNKFSARDPEEKDRKLVTPDKSKKILKGMEKERKEAQKQDEMEALIKQLGSMSLDDPNYGILYYRAIVMDPRVEKIIRPPQFQGSSVPS